MVDPTCAVRLIENTESVTQLAEKNGHALTGLSSSEIVVVVTATIYNLLCYSCGVIMLVWMKAAAERFSTKFPIEEISEAWEKLLQDIHSKYNEKLPSIMESTDLGAQEDDTNNEEMTVD